MEEDELLLPSTAFKKKAAYGKKIVHNDNEARFYGGKKDQMELIEARKNLSEFRNAPKTKLRGAIGSVTKSVGRRAPRTGAKGAAAAKPSRAVPKITPKTATGGAGLSNSITGTYVTRAGGGGNGGYAQGYGGAPGSGGSGGGGIGSKDNGVAAGSGTVNTGSGGGGGPNDSNAPGSGGSGIVILRYLNTYRDISIIPPGLTYNFSNTGGYKIYTFTAGTGSIII
jgi:hypothetical protein